MPKWSPFSRNKNASDKEGRLHDSASTDDPEGTTIQKRPKWSLGILQDKETDEVPGSVLLLSKFSKRNEPLGLQHAPARTSASSLPSPYPPGLRSRSRTPTRDRKKKTANGVILEPQPDDSGNDPLNWPIWRRNAALLSLGFYCMMGGGMTPVLAAGFQQVATSYRISVSRVSLSTGLYMMGLGLGSVVMSPTAIQFGKRPVYLASCVLFIISSVWCALSPNFASLIVARIFQGIAVSPVECLPSATIAEIFFLHERAYRLGIYTLLLLGGKNLIPLVSAAIIETLGWRWVFWIVAMILGFGGVLLFLFVPETFWDRTPRARQHNRHGSLSKLHLPHLFHRTASGFSARHQVTDPTTDDPSSLAVQMHPPHSKRKGEQHVAFEQTSTQVDKENVAESDSVAAIPECSRLSKLNFSASTVPTPQQQSTVGTPLSSWQSPADWEVVDQAGPAMQAAPNLRNLNSPWYEEKAKEHTDYFTMATQSDLASPAAGVQNVAQTKMQSSVVDEMAINLSPANVLADTGGKDKVDKHVSLPAANPNHSTGKTSRRSSMVETAERSMPEGETESGGPIQPVQTPIHSIFDEKSEIESEGLPLPAGLKYTEHYRSAPLKTYKDTLKPYHGRLSHENWFRIAVRPFVLFLYPSILWSAMVYSLSVGWLIVLSESVSVVYKNRDSYNFNSIQTGLVYLSPFVGGIMGTAVAGRISDIIVRFMARRNDGVYEPEFRLVMAIPIAITSTIGLMGFGWSAAERDMWFVPTFFFGVISFGCSLGSTTAITFAVDSYRQYAGEALVTLNFSKNIFHGLVFSLFFTSWLESDGSKKVFIAVGGIQLACLLLSVPMYIYGKRARMWTVRKNMLERF
ncbi:hypothetical protein, variant 2 [Verruconis gallopava]|uniref:Major facilitator superfamily (MFS) profile domain-containing protein n=1 Tax=Verruconis gallopava TaxID=253628 RepID=A0A0D2ALW9_9PEZI|nr:uncharacterized protein PV09_01694 [Verruconis gallopava]XP_016217636.1 hypothetical protein, variant 1 [Verruconis gallopava]XP_016217637.1 hypothetical protein, variant 2 [Verruconis gallopava]KIW07766.1 hypothetical protein PV09_01694 [Verruconis gallopava]KIW07767.1 hypothetical protein, variant 1 [Verruconis gallopava]KIW07768.1 hypothetical protein, variant 2 [Verruconis gallopava]